MDVVVVVVVVVVGMGVVVVVTVVVVVYTGAGVGATVVVGGTVVGAMVEGVFAFQLPLQLPSQLALDSQQYPLPSQPLLASQ